MVEVDPACKMAAQILQWYEQAVPWNKTSCILTDYPKRANSLPKADSISRMMQSGPEHNEMESKAEGHVIKTLIFFTWLICHSRMDVRRDIPDLTWILCDCDLMCHRLMFVCIMMWHFGSLRLHFNYIRFVRCMLCFRIWSDVQIFNWSSGSWAIFFVA